MAKLLQQYDVRAWVDVYECGKESTYCAVVVAESPEVAVLAMMVNVQVTELSRVHVHDSGVSSGVPFVSVFFDDVSVDQRFGFHADVTILSLDVVHALKTVQVVQYG